MGSWAERMTRRGVLRVGTLGGVGLGLTDVLRADEDRAAPAAADACILLFLNGGPSHLDMWDMKPDAPPEIRGSFKPIATSQPGVFVSEYLPRLSRWMHEATLLRSVRHSINNAHAAAVYAALTGHDRGELGGGAAPSDHPAIGSVMGLLRPPARAAAPFVNLPYITKEGRGGPPQPGFFGGLLGRKHDPLSILADPNEPGFAVPELTLDRDLATERLRLRDRLRQVVDPPDAARFPAGPARTVDALRERAMSLLSSPATQRAFQLDQEPAAVRDAYGRNIYGQSVLLARRLVEAGTRVVTVSWAPDANATWDTHGGNFDSLKGRHLPQLDAALPSLLADLGDRGMLARTLVVVMGEFGRSPRVNASAGRDHWNFCYTAMLVGGGIQRGAVFGASDRIGAFPKSDPIGPADIVATIYDRMGISPRREIADRLARPFQVVPWGEPIRAILA